VQAGCKASHGRTEAVVTGRKRIHSPSTRPQVANRISLQNYCAQHTFQLRLHPTVARCMEHGTGSPLTNCHRVAVRRIETDVAEVPVHAVETWRAKRALPREWDRRRRFGEVDGWQSTKKYGGAMSERRSGQVAPGSPLLRNKSALGQF